MRTVRNSCSDRGKYTVLWSYIIKINLSDKSQTRIESIFTLYRNSTVKTGFENIQLQPYYSLVHCCLRSNLFERSTKCSFGYINKIANQSLSVINT